MPEWLPAWLHDVQPEDDLGFAALIARLAVALVLGCVVAAIYRWTSAAKQAGQSHGLLATLVLLTLLICMVTLVIGNSVARAFSLVGALAIVRFRTVVEDTRDTAFVIFAVAVGMAAGAGWRFLVVPLAGIPFVALAAFLFRPRAAAATGDACDYLLQIRIGVGHDPAALLAAPFEKHLAAVRLVTLATARQGVALDLTYSVRVRHENAVLALIAALNSIEGVQNVELRRA